MNSEIIRTFIAISLPAGLKQELSVLESQLKRRCPDVVKWVEPESIHLTLEFLGDMATEKIDEVKLGIEEAAHGLSPCRLEVRGTGAFPNLDRVQVIWVGTQGELDKLAQLQERITANMEQFGFPGEERAFSPHLTLGRVRNYAGPEERKKIGQVLAATTFTSACPIEVNGVSLIKSQLTPKGAIYTPLFTVRLGV
jgi:RNA 2',3'-cyclic 3'-phosphodiesterase